MGNWRTIGFAVFIVLLQAFCLVPKDAAADVPVRKVGLRLNGQMLQATFSYKDLFNREVQKKLKSGLPTKILVQVALENKKNKPVALWAKTVTVVYDLWEENYAITVQDPKGKRRARVKTLDEVLKVAGVLFRVYIANVKDLQPGEYRLKVIAEANPVSNEMVRNIQRWISRPSGGYGGGGAGTSYFGSFVGYFVDRNISKSDKSIRFVSQWFQL